MLPFGHDAFRSQHGQVSSFRGGVGCCHSVSHSVCESVSAQLLFYETTVPFSVFFAAQRIHVRHVSLVVPRPNPIRAAMLCRWCWCTIRYGTPITVASFSPGLTSSQITLKSSQLCSILPGVGSATYSLQVVPHVAECLAWIHFSHTVGQKRNA